MKTRAPASTHKKVVIVLSNKKPVRGYLNPARLGQIDPLDVLTPDGEHQELALATIRSVYFVRDFSDDFEPERKAFLSRPKQDGLWLRLRYLDGETLEGVVPNDLLSLIDNGLQITPPDLNSSTDRIFIPRSALSEVTVLGEDPGRHRGRLKSRIGIVLQSTGVDRYLTVAETIRMFAGYYPHPRPVDEVIHLVGLDAKRDERVLKLSGGQQRRLDVAIALAGDPELLFLDEPTTGFDPSARREAWDVVKDLAALGKTVLLTTHYMEEAQYLADRVAVIAAGLIVAQGPPASLGARDTARARIRYRPPEGLAGPLGPDGFTELAADDVTLTLHKLTGWAIDQGVSLDGLEVTRPSLEDVYLALTDASSGADGNQPAPQAAGERGSA